MIEDDKNMAANVLSNLGSNLLAIDEAGLAIEVLDEAMECAIEVNDMQIMQSLAESMVLANSALTDKESQQNEELRLYLDGLNNLDESSTKAFEQRISDIEKQAEELAKPLDETWNDWQPASKLFPDDIPLTVMRIEVDDDGECLVVSHHSELGMIGFWMPKGDFNISPGHKLSIGNSRVKVAVAPEFLREKHSIRALIALEIPQEISFSTKLDF